MDARLYIKSLYEAEDKPGTAGFFNDDGDNLLSLFGLSWQREFAMYLDPGCWLPPDSASDVLSTLKQREREFQRMLDYFPPANQAFCALGTAS